MAPLVLLHGYPFDHSMWDRVLPHLRSGVPVLTPDLRGFGSFPVGLEPPRLEVMADDVAEFLDGQDHEQAVIVGFSMGGYVALAFAERYPGRVGGIGLINSQPAADSHAMRKLRQALIERVLNEGAAVAAETALPKMFGNVETTRGELAQYPRRGAQAAGVGGITWALEAMARRPDRTELLKRIQAPILLLHADRDQFVPVENIRELSQAIPNADYVEIAGTGHCSPLESPAAVAAAVDTFALRCQKG